jgi:hypothetical protein
MRVAAVAERRGIENQDVPESGKKKRRNTRENVAPLNNSRGKEKLFSFDYVVMLLKKICHPLVTSALADLFFESYGDFPRRGFSAKIAIIKNAPERVERDFGFFGKIRSF